MCSVRVGWISAFFVFLWYIFFVKMDFPLLFIFLIFIIFLKI